MDGIKTSQYRSDEKESRILELVRNNISLRMSVTRRILDCKSSYVYEPLTFERAQICLLI